MLYFLWRFRAEVWASIRDFLAGLRDFWDGLRGRRRARRGGRRGGGGQGAARAVFDLCRSVCHGRGRPLLDRGADSLQLRGVRGLVARARLSAEPDQTPHELRATLANSKRRWRPMPGESLSCMPGPPTPRERCPPRPASSSSNCGKRCGSQAARDLSADAKPDQVLLRIGCHCWPGTLWVQQCEFRRGLRRRFALGPLASGCGVSGPASLGTTASGGSAVTLSIENSIVWLLPSFLGRANREVLPSSERATEVNLGAGARGEILRGGVDPGCFDYTLDGYRAAVGRLDAHLHAGPKVDRFAANQLLTADQVLGLAPLDGRHRGRRKHLGLFVRFALVCAMLLQADVNQVLLTRRVGGHQRRTARRRPPGS